MGSRAGNQNGEERSIPFPNGDPGIQAAAHVDREDEAINSNARIANGAKVTEIV